MSEDMIFDPGRYSDSPASTTAPAAPAPVAPGGPTSPPAAPSLSRELEIRAAIKALDAQAGQEVNSTQRAKLADAKLALFRELEGDKNRVHLTINPAPGERRPEQEAAPSVYGDPPEVPGKEWDRGALTTFKAVAATNRLTPADHQAVLREYAWSAQREGMDSAARVDAAVAELEREWGPEDGNTFQVNLDHAEQELTRLHPGLVVQLKAVGGHWDAWPIKRLAALWQKRHPQP